MRMWLAYHVPYTKNTMSTNIPYPLTRARWHESSPWTSQTLFIVSLSKESHPTGSVMIHPWFLAPCAMVHAMDHEGEPMQHGYCMDENPWNMDVAWITSHGPFMIHWWKDTEWKVWKPWRCTKNRRNGGSKCWEVIRFIVFTSKRVCVMALWFYMCAKRALRLWHEVCSRSVLTVFV